MKDLKQYKATLLPLLSAIALVMLAGCYEERPYYGGPPPPPPPVAVEGYDYYYYPDEEVYFYPTTGVFFWYGGGGWHNGRRLPPTIVLHEQARECAIEHARSLRAARRDPNPLPRPCCGTTRRAP